MGVTLERVQNKFACIIGELCNEPYVLSQFAIWVDLRIAEYKAKGAISLDCSGDEPDPSWLKGHKSKPTEEHQREIIHDDYDRYHGEQLDSKNHGDWAMDSGVIPVHSLEERLSPQLVDQEPVVSGHPHRNVANQKLKRRYSDNSSPNQKVDIDNSDELYEPRNSKAHRKMTVPKQIEKETNFENQSLMSIIQNSDQNNEEVTYSVEEGEESFSVTISDDFDAASSQVSPGYGAASQPGSSSHSKTDTSSLISPQCTVPVNSHPSNQWRDHLQDLYHCDHPCTTTQNIKQRIKDVQGKSGTLVSDMVKIVRILQTWLWNRFSEDRFVEHIPPVEMDHYLTLFFDIICKQNGTEFTMKALYNLRSYLDRFLRENGYNVSITKSAVFCKSIEAFTLKKMTIQESVMYK